MARLAWGDRDHVHDACTVLTWAPTRSCGQCTPERGEGQQGDLRGARYARLIFGAPLNEARAATEVLTEVTQVSTTPEAASSTGGVPTDEARGLQREHVAAVGANDRPRTCALELWPINGPQVGHRH